MKGTVGDWIRDHLGLAEKPGPAADTPARPPPNLYECSHCETTYVSEDMESCPECRADLVRIPSERDLEYMSPARSD